MSAIDVFNPAILVTSRVVITRIYKNKMVHKYKIYTNMYPLCIITKLIHDAMAISYVVFGAPLGFIFPLAGQ